MMESLNAMECVKNGERRKHATPVLRSGSSVIDESIAQIFLAQEYVLI
jgi:hypothetical protein